MAPEEDGDPSACHVPARAGRHGCFFYGCLTLLVLGALGFAGVGSTFYYGRSTLAPICDKYMALAAGTDLKAAYAMLGPRWHAVQSYEDYASMGKAIHDRLGAPVKRTVTEVQMSTRTDGKFAGVRYDVSFTKAPCTVRFLLQKLDRQWIVQAAYYDSPALADLMECPYCGAKQKEWAGFCMSCGEAMPGRASSAELTTTSLETTAATPQTPRPATGKAQAE